MYHIVCYILSVCLLSPFAVSVAYTQDSIPTHTVDGKYIREWLVLGPFFPDDLKTDFLSDVGGEANIVPKEGDSVKTADERTLKWQRYISNEDSIDLVKAIGDHEKATAYAFCNLQIKNAGPFQFRLGSDDGVAVWINGELVHQNDIPRSLSLDEDIFGAALKAGDSRCLVKISQEEVWDWGFALRVVPSPPDCAVLSGMINNEAGQPIPEAFLYLEQNGVEAAHARTDASGKYQLIVYPAHGIYDLSAIADNLGDWQLGISLDAGERRKLDMKLKETISISGTVLALENKAPMANALIQAVAVDSMPKLIFAALSDKEGKYQIENMKPGRYQVWCRIPGGEVYYGEKKNTPPVLQIERGKIFKDINFRFIYLKKQIQKKAQLPSSTLSGAMSPLKPFFEEQVYNARVGAESVRSAIVDAQGYTWFKLVAISIEPPFRRFDGKRFAEVENTAGDIRLTYPNYTRDADGKVWIAGSKGVARLWNGKVEKYFTVQDGLPSNTIRGIMADKSRGIWISTNTGISYIHKENGVDKISPVVDSSGVPYMKVDSEDGLWWIENPGMTTVQRLFKTPQGFSRTLKIQFPSISWEYNEVAMDGFLIKAKDGPYVYFRADGMGYALDKRLTRFLGSDPEGKLYFATEAGEGFMKIVRDEPDSEGNFGYSTSPAQFEFPTKLSTSYDLVENIRNEIWLFSWIADKPVLVIRGNEIVPAKDIYLSDLMLGSYFMSADDETIWARGWGKREVMELYFPEGIEFEICPLDLNGLQTLQYNHKTGSYYFIFQSPDFTNNSIISYQNREWRELIKSKSQDFSYQTDTFGNTWIADVTEDSSSLICINADGHIEQQSAQFKTFSPDDRGGCYLLTANGLQYYKDKKLTTYPISGIEGFDNITAFRDGSVYLKKGNKLYHWTPEGLRQITTENSLPDGEIEKVWKSSTKLFFRVAGQIGWIENGNISLVDTDRYPELKNMANVQQDNKGRLFFYGYPDEVNIREIWMLEGEKLTKLSLPEPTSGELIFGDDEVVLIGYNSKIYRYSQEHQQFYTLINTGNFIGYLWEGYIANGNLVVSGWGKCFIKIDLKNAPPTFPRLSFQSIGIDGREVEEQESYTLSPDAVLKASYIAIEKLSQSNVFYQTRLAGLEDEWSEPTKNESVEFRNLPSARYRLEIRTEGESQLWGIPIGFDIEVTPPIFYKRPGFVILLSFIGGISLLMAGIFGVQRWRLSHAEKLRLQHELEDAHQMQVRLLPERAPTLQGFDIAGFSRPAREVGGDFFDYLSLGDGKIGIALADVSGKGLKAAMNTVLANGMLREVAVIEGTPGRSLSRLNADLYTRIEKLMFVALVFGILDSSSRILKWSNAGQPCPMVKRGEEVFEFKSDGHLPLGMMPEIAYPDWELELQAGDVIIFYTDGIIEAEGETEEMYSAERLEQILKSMNSKMTADETIKVILKDVRDFVGNMEQYDDITIVVVKKL